MITSTFTPKGNNPLYTLLWDYPAAACIFLFFTFPISFGPGFALGNRNHRLCGQAYANFGAVRFANPILSDRGSRPETEIIGFAGRRARTLLSSGAHFPLLPVWSSRPETEIIGFARRRARTLPPSGSLIPISFGLGFALENRNRRLCGDASANFAAVRFANPHSFGSGFALGNRNHWLCGEASANFAVVRGANSHSFGPGFALGNRNHWLCGDASANFAAVRFANSHSFGPGFAPGNRNHWLCGQAYANWEPGKMKKSDYASGIELYCLTAEQYISYT